MDPQGKEAVQNSSKGNLPPSFDLNALPVQIEDAAAGINKKDTNPIDWARGSIDVAEDGRLAFIERESTQSKSKGFNNPQDFPCACELFDLNVTPVEENEDLDVSLWPKI